MLAADRGLSDAFARRSPVSAEVTEASPPRLRPFSGTGLELVR